MSELAPSPPLAMDQALLTVKGITSEDENSNPINPVTSRSHLKNLIPKRDTQQWMRTVFEHYNLGERESSHSKGTNCQWRTVGLREAKVIPRTAISVSSHQRRQMFTSYFQTLWGSAIWLLPKATETSLPQVSSDKFQNPVAIFLSLNFTECVKFWHLTFTKISCFSIIVPASFHILDVNI